MWGDGFYRQRNLEAGLGMREVNPTTQFCFAVEIRGSARLIFGNKDEAREGKKKRKC